MCMANKGPRSDKWPGFEIAIEGEGLSPEEVPIRQLVELLESAVNAVQVLADERGIKLQSPRLVAVRQGSAAYDLRIPDESAAPLVVELESQIQTRGKEGSHEVRRALERMNKAGRMGSVRFRAYRNGKLKAKPLYVAPPFEVAIAPFEAQSEVIGRVVGVVQSTTRLTVNLRLDDGHIESFVADQESGRLAARLFLSVVRAEVVYDVERGKEDPAMIIGLEGFGELSDDSVLAAFDEAREELIGEGVSIRASDWLRELQDDE